MLDYSEKFSEIQKHTAFGLLLPADQEFLRIRAHELRFTQQELRRISEMALDRQRWKESPISESWPQLAQQDPVQHKKKILVELDRLHDALRARGNDYAKFDRADRPKTRKPALKTRVQPKLGLGRCPVASEKTRCCNLLTLDAVEKCGFDCSYCSIQSFYHGNEVVFDSGFADKLRNLDLDPDQTYHIGTGQSSDSLMWGNHGGILESLCEFAESNPNVVLELKTKSRNIRWLLDNPVPRNILCTWSLNTQTIIDNEEHLSASLTQRLDAARAVADKGLVVGFHFHPVVHYAGWDADYPAICAELTSRFDAREVALVSLGTLTFTRSVMKTIRSRDLKSKILQMPLEPAAGKLSYPVGIKTEMFSRVYDALDPWHQDVFFYLCMEPHDLWQPVFGYQYESNQEFEAAMKSAYLSKIYQTETDD